MTTDQPKMEMPNGIGGLISVQQEKLDALKDAIISLEKLAGARFGFVPIVQNLPVDKAAENNSSLLPSRMKELIYSTGEFHERLGRLYEFLETATT